MSEGVLAKFAGCGGPGARAGLHSDLGQSTVRMPRELDRMAKTKWKAGMARNEYEYGRATPLRGKTTQWHMLILFTAQECASRRMIVVRFGG